MEVYVLHDRNEEITYLTIFSVARTLRKLFQRKPNTDKFSDPELKSLEGLKCLAFLWIHIYLMIIYSLDQFMRNKWQFIV